MKKNDGLIKPVPIRGFTGKEVLYFPVDSPSGVLRNAIKKNALKEVPLGFGRLFLLSDKLVVYQAVGAPASVLCLESLIASGAQQILVLGFSGSLNPDFPMESAVSISRALSEEGTSRHYFRQRRYFKPSAELKRLLEKNLSSRSLPFREGSIVSTDAPYRETKAWLEQKQERGIDLVDMETSAIFSLAEYRGIQAAALMLVSDELWRSRWKQIFSSPSLENRMKEYFLPFL